MATGTQTTQTPWHHGRSCPQCGEPLLWDTITFGFCGDTSGTQDKADPAQAMPSAEGSSGAMEGAGHRHARISR